MSTNNCSPNSDNRTDSVFRKYGAGGDGTNKYSYIDDGVLVSANDGDTGYLEVTGGSAGVTAQDFGFSHSVPAGASINFVRIHCVHRVTDTTDPPKCKMSIYDGSNETLSSNETSVSSTSYPSSETTEHESTFSTNPAGSAWAYSDLATLKCGMKVSDSGALKGGNFRCTEFWIEIDYTSTQPKPTNPKVDKQTNPTNAYEVPLFTVTAQASGSETFTKAHIQVSTDNLFATNIIAEDDNIAITTVGDGDTAEVWYDDDGASGTWSTSEELKSGQTYYWRMRLWVTYGGTVSEWTYGVGDSGCSYFEGVKRAWADADYVYRKKLLLNTDHPTVPVGYTASFEVQTGNRQIPASNGCFNEAIGASGGFQIVTFGNRTHIVYLSETNASQQDTVEYEIWIVSMDRGTGEWGTPFYLHRTGTSYDTHFFPVIECDNYGYIHVMTSGHNSYLRYTRSRLPNQSGSIATDTQENTWIKPSALPSISTIYDIISTYGTYPVLFFVPTTGYLYCAFRQLNGEGRYVFIRTTESSPGAEDIGKTWSQEYTIIDDTTAYAYRAYAYGHRYDKVNHIWHMAFTMNQTDPVTDAERGVWYAYSPLDETDGSSLDVGFNLWYSADGTLRGRTSEQGNDGHTTRKPLIDYDGWSTFESWAIVLSHYGDSDNLFLPFIQNLALDKNMKPVIFYEQKFWSGSAGVSYAYTRETSSIVATWSGNLGSSGSWIKTYVSDDLNFLMRVRRSGLCVQTDIDGVIKMWWPVSGKTFWMQYPDTDESSSDATPSTGSDNYAVVNKPFSQPSAAEYLSIADGGNAFFSCDNAVSADKQILGVQVMAVVQKSGASDASVTLGLKSGANTDTETAHTVSEGTNWVNISDWWWEDPWTTSAWTTATVNGLQMSIASVNGLDIIQMILKVYYTCIIDTDIFSGEIVQFKSLDNGLTWEFVKEESRNTTIGVPIIGNAHYLSQGQIEATWTNGNDIFYLTDEPYGKMMTTGEDFKIYKQVAGTQTEIDRIMNAPNLNPSIVEFKIQSEVAEGATAGAVDYYIYYGNANETTKPKGDPNEVYLFFENWEQLPENAMINTLSAWTGPNAVVAYWSPPEDPTHGETGHSNKVGAGKVCAYSPTITTPEIIAAGVGGTGTDGISVEFFGWAESANQVWCKIIDSSANYIRFGHYTNYHRIYDGADWVYEFDDYGGFVARTVQATMFHSKLALYDQKVNLWVNGNESVVAYEGKTYGGMPTTDLKDITFYCESKAFFDLIIVKRYLTDYKTITITSITDNVANWYSGDGVGDKYYDNTRDAKHEFAETELVRYKIKYSVKIYDDADPDYPHTVTWRTYRAPVSPYDGDEYVSYFDMTKEVTTGNTEYYYYSDWIIPSTDRPNAESFIVVIRESTYTGVWAVYVRIEEIDIIDKAHDDNDYDPVVVIGDEEVRGVTFDVTLQGAGRTVLLGSYKINTYTFQQKTPLNISAIADKCLVQRLPVETSKGFVATNQFPLDYTKGIEFVFKHLVEYAAGFVQTGYLPVEYWSVMRFLKKFPVEYTTGFEYAGRLPVEYWSVMRFLYKFLVEYTEGYTETFDLPIDYKAGSRISNKFPIEYTEVYAEASDLPIEYKAGYKLLTAFFIEYAKGYTESQNIDIEYCTYGCHSNLIIIEYTQRKENSFNVLVEYKGGFVNVCCLPVEYNCSTTFVNKIQIDITELFEQIERVPVEYIADKSYLNKTAVEWTRDQNFAEKFPLENLGQLSSISKILVEYNKERQTAGQFAVEFLEGFDYNGLLWVENQLELETGALFPVEYAKGHQYTEQLHVEYLPGFNKINRIPVEIVGDVAKAFGIPIEYVEDRSTNRWFPIEHTVVNPTLGYTFNVELTAGRIIVPHFLIEYSGMASVYLGSFPIEYRGGLKSGALVPVQIIVDIENKAQIPVNYVADVVRKSQINIEYNLSIRTILAQFYVAYAGAYKKTAQIPIEYALSVENVLSSIPVEYRGSLAQTYAVAIETLLRLSSGAQIPIEHGVLNSMLSVLFPVEYAAGIQISGNIPIEFSGLATIGLYAFPIEYGSGILSIKKNIPIEYTESLGYSLPIMVEHTKSIDYILQIFASYLGSYRQTKDFPVEYLTVNQDIISRFPVEFGLSVPNIIGKFPVDRLGPYSTTQQLSVEYLKSFSGAYPILIEYLKGFSSAYQLPVEYLKGFAAAYQIPVEYLKGLSAAYRIPVEYLKSFLGAYRLPVEYLKGFAAAYQIPVEYLKGLSAAYRIPVEYTAGVPFVQAYRFPIEISSVAVAVGIYRFLIENLGPVKETSFIPVEYNLGVQSTTVVVVEYTLSAVARDTFAVEYGTAFRQAVDIITEYLGGKGIKINLNIDYRATKQFTVNFSIEYGHEIVVTDQFNIETLISVLIRNDIPIAWLGTVIAALIIRNATLKVSSIADPSLFVSTLSEVLMEIAKIKGTSVQTSQPSLSDLALSVNSIIDQTTIGGTSTNAS